MVPVAWGDGCPEGLEFVAGDEPGFMPEVDSVVGVGWWRLTERLSYRQGWADR